MQAIENAKFKVEEASYFPPTYETRREERECLCLKESKQLRSSATLYSAFLNSCYSAIRTA